jgi:alkylated DNA repair dioxygenase AlkB
MLKVRSDVQGKSSPAADTVPAVIRPDAPTQRLHLDQTSWVDVTRGWIDADDAAELADSLRTGLSWRQGRLWRYERWVDEPRLGAQWRPGADPTPHPGLLEAHRSLRDRYGVRFESVGLARYRDGADGQAFHRDRDMRWLDDTIIAVLTVGARRPWLLRPRSRRHHHEAPARGATHDLSPCAGDLLVMGGRCQADWEHSVPQLRGTDGRGRPGVGERISLQWRWTSRQGPPERGASYRAPRHFSRR